MARLYELNIYEKLINCNNKQSQKNLTSLKQVRFNYKIFI